MKIVEIEVTDVIMIDIINHSYKLDMREDKVYVTMRMTRKQIEQAVEILAGKINNQLRSIK